MSVAGAARDPVPPQRDRPAEAESPPRGGAILTVLILGAVVANINLAIANVALPSIGAALDTSQAELNLIAVGFTLGLASSVLYLGALADRYGRKPAMMLGAALSVPASLLAAWAPSGTVLIAARVGGGVAAGLLYPITLSLITGLFRGGARTRAIALWSGIGGGCSALGPLLGGLLLGRFWWGSVFLVSVPIAVLVVLLAGLWLPRHAGETSEPVDHLGGVLSVVSIGPLVLAISLVPNYGFNGTVLGLFAVSLVGLVLFVLRQRRAPSPLFDLKVLRARTFTIALVGGTITWDRPGRPALVELADGLGPAGRQAVPPGTGGAARRRRSAGIRGRQDGRDHVRRDRVADRPRAGAVPLPEHAGRGGDLRAGGRAAAAPPARGQARAGARSRRPGRRTRRTPLTHPLIRP